MSGTSDEAIWSDDYTRLARHESRSFNAGDMSLAFIGGVAWGATGVAASRTFKVWLPRLILPAAAVLWLAGASPFLALLLVPIVVIVEYVRATKERDSGLTLAEEIAIRKLAKSLPTTVVGWTADSEPHEIDWHVIMFVPDWSKSCG